MGLYLVSFYVNGAQVCHFPVPVFRIQNLNVNVCCALEHVRECVVQRALNACRM